jgi:YidC/Oxa1 family membrane protein insertase
MDRNTITGFVLIAVILGGFYFLTKPNPEQLKAQQHLKDSIAQVSSNQTSTLPIKKDSLSESNADSTAVNRANSFGAFANASTGKESFQKIETELFNITFSNKGGRISSVELKKYKTFDHLPLYLFNGADEDNYGFTLTTANSRVINTSDLYFKFQGITKTKDAQIVTLRLEASEKSYIDFVYTISNNDYMLHFDIVPVGMKDVLDSRLTNIEMQWKGKIRQQEKGHDFENRYAGLYYKYQADDVENLSTGKTDEKILTNRLRWVAFKDQFFSSIMIADQGFSSPKVSSTMQETTSTYLKGCSASMTVPFDVQGKKTAFRFYFGPNQFKTLNLYDKGVKEDDQLDIQKLVPLGWTLFRWVNRILVIPMFNFFGSFISNFGLIILLMTIVIKMILFPLTYKSYISSAKMRVLKPEIEKINEKHSADKPAERQKATMELYNRVGVNPMGGCLPMLLQMPILFAMFSFFPASIELRQQSFLWATDLSSYDSILNLPFTIPFYGAHVSLFCLLMTITNLAYTKVNMAATDTGSQQMPGMKVMMYLMPLMFLFLFNNYASGLSYYYFISTLITIIQTYAIRATVDEDKLLKQLYENKKKPAKKTGFMARLEQAQKQQAEIKKKK